MTSSSSKFADAVSRMVHRVNLQEGHEAGTRPISSHQQGPLKPQELAELSFLCTAAAAASSSAAASSNNNSEQAANAGFASVEGDLLVAVIEMLDRHVNLAVGVHLIDDALKIYRSDAAPSVHGRRFRQGT